MVLTDFDKKNLNAVGQQAILTATDEWNKANAAGDQAGMAKWSAIAAQVRSTAGYETDSSGNFTNYIPGANTQNKSVTVIGNNSNNESAVTKLPSTPELNNQGVQNLPLNTENKPDITYLADTSQNTAAPLSRSSQQSSNQTVSAGNINADGKIYADGGSGKQFAYNPATGNIGVFNNGAWSYVTPDNSTYEITKNAMLADTGKNFDYFQGTGAAIGTQNNISATQNNISTTQNQSTQNTAAAQNFDGKIYADGLSGKQFVYNPQNGNIGVYNNGVWSYVTPDNELYNITLNAMLADTGKSLEYFNGGVTADKQGENKQNGLPQDNNLNGITGYDDIYQAVLDYLTQGQNYQNTAIDNAVKQQQALIEAQKQAAQQAYLENNKNAYTAYQKAVNPYGYNAEVMAAMGLAKSGLSESSLVAYGNALMAALQSNSISYNEAIAALENQKIQAQYEGDMNKAQIAADLQNQIASLFLELGNAQLQYSQQTQQNSQTDARSRIETYLMSGGSLENLDPQLIADAGYSSAELDALAAYAATQNSQTSQADARERIAAYLSMGGSLKNLDPQLIADSGYTAEELNAMEAYVNMQNANMSSTIGSANTGTGGAYGTSATTGTTDTEITDTTETTPNAAANAMILGALISAGNATETDNEAETGTTPNAAIKTPVPEGAIDLQGLSDEEIMKMLEKYPDYAVEMSNDGNTPLYMYSDERLFEGRDKSRINNEFINSKIVINDKPYNKDEFDRLNSDGMLAFVRDDNGNFTFYLIDNGKKAFTTSYYGARGEQYIQGEGIDTVTNIRKKLANGEIIIAENLQGDKYYIKVK